MTIALSGCFNPRLIGKEQPRENHVPAVEVFPEPSNEPIIAKIGDPSCATEELTIVTLDDADGDNLTVRFDILRTLGTGPRRTNLQESLPIEPQDGVYEPIGLTTLKLDEDTVGGINLGTVDTQLIELRVSDSGFQIDENNTPVPGAGGPLFFMSWIVRIDECPGAG